MRKALGYILPLLALVAIGAAAVYPTAPGETTSAMTLYVALDGGSDRAPCTQAKPCATVGAALAKVPDTIKHMVKIELGAGTYPENVVLSKRVVGKDGFLALEGQLVDYAPDAGASCFTLGAQTGTPNNWSYLVTPVGCDGGVWTGESWSDREFKGQMARFTSGPKAEPAYSSTLTTAVVPVTEFGVPTDGGTAFVTLTGAKNGWAALAGERMQFVKPAATLIGDGTDRSVVEADGLPGREVISNEDNSTVFPVGAYGTQVGKVQLNAIGIQCAGCSGSSTRAAVDSIGGQLGLNWVNIRRTPASYMTLAQYSTGRVYLHASILNGEGQAIGNGAVSFFSSAASYFATNSTGFTYVYTNGSIFDLTLREIPAVASHACFSTAGWGRGLLYHTLITNCTSSGVNITGAPGYIGLHTVDLVSPGNYGLATGTSAYRDINQVFGIYSNVTISGAAVFDVYLGPNISGSSLSDLRLLPGKVLRDPTTGNAAISN